MTANSAQELILTQLDIIAQSRYPNDPQLQAQFKIGFLTAQLAHTWLTDSRYYTEFKHTVNRLGYTKINK